jgi:hypothetical protein
MDLTLMPAFINIGTIVIVAGNGFNLGTTYGPPWQRSDYSWQWI